MNSPCSKWLKIIPMQTYAFKNQIKYDLIGYVKHELKRRGERQQSKIQPTFFDAIKTYPIGQYTDEWCFEIVDKWIGWHPRIYDILDKKGKRIFKHNNCLPCKNMTNDDIQSVKEYYPEYYFQAIQLSKELKKYWVRSDDDF
jgi:hypothetical protein